MTTAKRYFYRDEQTREIGPLPLSALVMTLSQSSSFFLISRVWQTIVWLSAFGFLCITADGAAPIVSSNAANNISPTNATLNGSVNPNGVSTGAYFQYGPTTSYGSTTSTVTLTGTSAIPISAALNGLSPGTTYHYRVVAISSDGISTGSNVTFSTPANQSPPSAQTSSASAISSSSAQLHGSVNPNGISTSAYFQYGLTTSYGSTTSSVTLTGHLSQSISAALNGLAPGTTYHYRVVAISAGGTSTGGNASFTTQSAPTPVPAISSVSPTSMPASGSLQALTIFGSNFHANATLTFDPPVGSDINSTESRFTSKSSTQLNYNINNANDAGVWRVRVNNPGGQSSNWANFTVVASTPEPTISLVNSGNPVVAAAGNPQQTITISGSNFVNKPTIFVTWGTGSSQNKTLDSSQVTFVSPTQLQMHIQLGAVAGNWTVRVTNPDGKQSNTLPFAVTVAAVGPLATTGAATEITSSSARINGTINPNGQNTNYSFRYGTDSTMNDFIGVTPIRSAGSGSILVNVSETIIPLSASTTYYYQLVAQGITGSLGEIRSFSTSPAPTSINITPTTRSIPAGGASNQSITISSNTTWTVTKNVDWVSITSATTSSGNGTVTYNVGANTSTWERTGVIQIGGLAHTIQQGSANLPGPTVITGGVAAVTASSGQLHGTVNPNGYNTFYTFQYGTDPSLENNSSLSPHAPVGSGSTTVPVSENLCGLNPNTTYYYRLSAVGAASSIGNILSFSTGAGSTPVITSINPDPVPAISGEQTITLIGSNFVSGSQVTLYDVTNDDGPYVKPAIYVNNNEIKVRANFTANTANWSAQVTSPALSNVRQFTVQASIQKPIARVDVSNTGPAPGATVTFRGTNSTVPAGRTITSYQWSFGDGSTQSGATVTHAYSALGVFHATLTVFDSAGQSDSRSIAINVAGNNLGNQNQSAMFADPVNLATGNFILDAEDLNISGMGFPLKFSRFYNSKDTTGTGTPIGQHWTHSYNLTLIETDEGDVHIHFGDGRMEAHYKQTDGSYVPESGIFSVLEKTTANAFILSTKELLEYHFTDGKLITISDRNGNTQTLEYDAGGKLKKITDISGRFLEFTYDTAGRILLLTDSLERTIAYEYDVAGNLVTVTDPREGITSYTYDAFHQMLDATDPNGNVFVTNEYDDLQRVVSYQKDAYGMRTDFSYDFENRLTSVTDPFGYVTLHLHDEKLRLIAQADELGNTEIYEYDDNNNRTVVVSRNGHETRYTYDSKGNVTSKTDALGYRTNIEYNARNDPVLRIDALGHETSFEYDDRGNLIRSVDPDGNSSAITYDLSGKPLTITDRNENVTTHEYDDEGNRIRTTDALDGVIEMVYDAVGRLLSVTNQNDQTSYFTYDDGDNLLSAEDPSGQIVTHEYDANGNRIRTSDARETVTDFEYDAKDRLIMVTDALGGVTRHDYDAYDRKIKTTDVRGNETLFEYDGAGHQIAVTNPLGQTITHEYDANGNRIATTNPIGNTTRFEYDVLDRLVSTTDPLGHVTTFAYDALGRRTSVTDALDRVTTSEFDAFGRLVKVTDPAGGTIIYTYDAEGNRTSATNPRGKTTLNDYDALNRLIRREEPGGSIEEWVYDGVGNRIQRIDAAGQTTDYTYDTTNRLIQITYSTTESTTFTYDANGNRTSMQDAVGSSSYTYDVLNRMTSYTNPFGHIVEYEYDAASNRSAMIYSGNKRVTYTYDDANRMITVVDWLENTTNYSYDDAGRLLSAQNPNDTLATYGYDTGGRLIALSNRRSDDSVISEYAYTLDATGNHLQVEEQEPLSRTLIPGSAISTYDDEDRLTTMGGVDQMYDAKGNFIGNGSNVRLTYDYDNRLVRFESDDSGNDTQWSYDGVGNRISVDWQNNTGSKTEQFVLDINTSLTQVIGIAGSDGQLLEYYVYGLGLISKIDANGNARYYHYDSRGTTIATTDEEGEIIASFAYDPFGRSLGREEPSGEFPERFTYLGRHGVVDDFNGLHYIRARHYSTRRGRFLQKDLFMGFDDQSQSLNRYVYALNNPMRLIDISGFSAKEATSEKTAMNIKSKVLLDDGLFSLFGNMIKGAEKEAQLHVIERFIQINAANLPQGINNFFALGKIVESILISPAKNAYMEAYNSPNGKNNFEIMTGFFVDMTAGAFTGLAGLKGGTTSAITAGAVYDTYRDVIINNVLYNPITDWYGDQIYGAFY